MTAYYRAVAAWHIATGLLRSWREVSLRAVLACACTALAVVLPLAFGVFLAQSNGACSVFWFLVGAVIGYCTEGMILVMFADQLR